MSRSRSLVLAALALLIMLGSFTASPASGEIAYIESLSVLYTLDLQTGETTMVGPTGVEERFSSLSFGPEGRLWGIGRTQTTAAALFELDPETGGATSIGVLGYDDLRALAIDGDGRFWASDDDQLFTLDPATGQATPGPVFEEEIRALAARGSQLFAVRSLGEFETSVLRIDTATGQLTPVLESFPLDLPTSDASFGGAGKLHLKTAFNGGSLLGINHAFVRVDLESGQVETTYETFTAFTDPLASMVSLAIRGGGPAVEVPTLGGSAIGVLVLSLAALGAHTLRRRRAPGVTV